MADDRAGKDKVEAKKHFNILDNIRTVVLAWHPTCDELMRITLRQEEASHAHAHAHSPNTRSCIKLDIEKMCKKIQ